MGTELGYSTFSLGGDAPSQLRLVAATCPECAAEFPSFPDRSCAWVLPDLRLPLAATEEPEVFAARLEPDARTNCRPRAAFRAAGRFNAGELRSEPARRRGISA